MKNILKRALPYIGILLAVSCSGVNFKKGSPCIVYTEYVCERFCEGDNCHEMVTRDIYFERPKFDLLVVVDNSASMSEQHRLFSEAFPNFMDIVSDLDYQLAIITTDVSESPGEQEDNAGNGYGDFQDGKFLEFPNGSKVLTRNDGSIDELNNWFANTMQREETLACDKYILDNANNSQVFNTNNSICASDDERGVYALDLAINNNEEKFFRSDTHIAVAIFSDEDERSVGGEDPLYPLVAQDIPKNVLENFKDLYPTKTISVHPIIIKPGDTACKQAQDVGYSSGAYGEVYDYLAQLTGETSGSLCGNYVEQLADIGDKVRNYAASQFAIPCDAETEQDVEVIFEPALSGDDLNTTNVNIDIVSSKINITPFVPKGTTVKLKVKCIL